MAIGESICDERRAACGRHSPLATRRCLSLVSCFCILTSALSAAEVSFSAAVDQTEVAVGEQFTLTVTVEGSGFGDLPSPRLPELDGFENLGSTRSSSQNISIIGGRVAQTVRHDFVYALSPSRPGSLTIGPCRITIDGTDYATEPITITVVSGGQAPKPRSPARQGPAIAIPGPGWHFAPPDRPGRAGRVQDNVELVARADRTSLYQGEQLTVTYTFYAAEEIRALTLSRSPSFSGFWAENVYEPSRLDYRSETHRGRRFYAATVRRAALFPAQSGELTIDQMTLAGSVLRGGGFFGFEEVPFQTSSEPIRITVRPLPDSGRPADFCGGVGDFRLSATLSRSSPLDTPHSSPEDSPSPASDNRQSTIEDLPVSSAGGEPLSLTITVSGTGNLGLLAAPAAPVLPGVNVLAPETRDNISHSGGRVSGTREFIYPLIPQADGRHVVPQRAVSFFNPKTGRYYTLTTPSLEFVATGTPRPTLDPRHSSLPDPGLRVLGTDIAHIRTSPLAPRHSTLVTLPWATPWWAWLFYPAGIAALLAGILTARHQRRLEQDRGYARRTRSSRVVRQRLKHAARQLAQSNLPGFYAALSQAAVGFVGDRFNVEAGAMTRDQLRQALQARGVAAEPLARFMELLGHCDVARFSPGIAECDPHELLRRAQEMLEKL